ncbi:MAG: glycosyltransferase family 4 protein, partial [Gemmatimonadota bacterium]
QYPRKDTRSLLDALPAVLTSVPDARLRVVGGGPELPALKRRAAELAVETSVTFLGEVGRRDDVAREYARADVFCLPSRQEGFGIVFLEAMATGLPIVACRAAAVPEVVPDGDVGLLVPPSDPASLARALVQVLGSPELGRRLGAAGRERARRYDWSRVAERFMTVVRDGRPDARDVA